MHPFPNHDQLAIDRVGASRKRSWFWDKRYHELIANFLDEAGHPRNSLIKADKFIIRFVKKAEKVKQEITPELIL